MNTSISRSLIVALAPLLALGACGRVESDYMVGTLERDRIEVIAESNEPIISIAVADGQPVAAEELILEQDPRRAQARLAQQVGLRDQSAARLAELQRGPRTESIREARARLDTSRLREANALATFDRTRELFARGLSSQNDLDRDETAYKTAVAQGRADSEALSLLLNGTTVEELDQSIAALQASDARVRQAQLDLERTRIVAPVSGIVDKVLYRRGERPAAGATVAVLLDGARTYARVYVPEPLRTRVAPGARLDVHVDGEAGSFPGTVRWVSADAAFTPYFALTEHDRSRLSFLAEIDVPDAAHLAAGVPLTAEFPDR